MSIISWVKEFYPSDAKSCPREFAAEHSLIKWRGYREENRKKHGCKEGRDLIHIWPTPENCALCVHYRKEMYLTGNRLVTDCSGCPVNDSRIGVPCDKPCPGEQLSPWSSFMVSGDPEPMIKALEGAIEHETELRLFSDGCTVAVRR